MNLKEIKMFLRKCDEFKQIYNDVSFINDIEEIDESFVKFGNPITLRYESCLKSDLIHINDDKIMWYWGYKLKGSNEIKVSNFRMSRREAFEKFEISDKLFDTKIQSFDEKDSKLYEIIFPLYNLGFVLNK